MKASDKFLKRIGKLKVNFRFNSAKKSPNSDLINICATRTQFGLSLFKVGLEIQQVLILT